ncbi:MAG: hypothetical protein AB7U75_19545 [Hyphomicrobiaceae bacterium]
MITDSEVLNYIFFGLVGFLFIMIFWNVLGAPRRSRRTGRARRSSGIAGTGGAPMVGWGDRADGGGDGCGGGGSHGCSDSGGDAGGDGGGD